AASVRVAVGGDHLEDTLVEFQNGNVESAAAEIVDGDDSVLAFIEAISQGRGGGLVHQPKDFKASNASSILRGLPLRIVEVCRNSDNGLRHRRAEITLGVGLELQQNVCRNLRCS